MAATRIPATLTAHVCLAGERPCLFVDCGCWQGKFHFEDCVELRALLRDAVRHRGMPEWTVVLAYSCAVQAMGSYEDQPAPDADSAGAECVNGARSLDARGRAIYRGSVSFLAFCGYVGAVGWGVYLVLVWMIKRS